MVNHPRTRREHCPAEPITAKELGGGYDSHHICPPSGEPPNWQPTCLRTAVWAAGYPQPTRPLSRHLAKMALIWVSASAKACSGVFSPRAASAIIVTMAFVPHTSPMAGVGGPGGARPKTPPAAAPPH